MFSFLARRFESSSAGRVRRRPKRAQRVPRVTLSVERLEDRTLPSAVAPIAPGNPQDFMYVGDGSDNTVKRFDAATGAFLGTTVASGSGGLNGPRGMIFTNPGQLLVVDQNVGEPNPGELLRYNAPTGKFLGNLVLQTDPNAPFAPRGMVLGPNHTLYVGDDGNLDGITIGRVARFNSETGAFLGDLQPTGFTGDFYPRGVVIGPDGLLYASVRNIAATGGEIMRWDPATGNFLGDFVDSNATNDLNRPEGIVFGPDGNLYVASFRANSGDTDKVLEFNGATGAYIGKIDLDQVGQPRAFGQALEFGPGGKLFVPISGNGPDTGAVRRYDVSTGTFDAFVPSNASGGQLGMPWYLTFGKTDSATLAYSDGAGAHGAAQAQLGKDPIQNALQGNVLAGDASIALVLAASASQHVAPLATPVPQPSGVAAPALSLGIVAPNQGNGLAGDILSTMPTQGTHAQAASIAALDYVLAGLDGEAFTDALLAS